MSGFKQVLGKIDVMEFGQRHVCDFFCRKQGLSKIEAVEFRNDNLSPQSTNQQPACYDVINDDVNDS